MEYTKEDLEKFCNNIWENNLSNNNGGIGAPDLFSFYFTLNQRLLLNQVYGMVYQLN